MSDERDPFLRRDALVAEFRRKVYAVNKITWFPHQADWQLASEGWTLLPISSDQSSSSRTTDVLVPLDALLLGESPSRTLTINNVDCGVVKRIIVPRVGGPAHVLADLAGYKGGKSFGGALWLSGFAIVPYPVHLIGADYSTSEPEFEFLCEFLLSERGMNIRATKFFNDRRSGRMLIHLPTGAKFEVKTWESKEALKGKRVICYYYAEAFQLPGLECFTSVAQNLRELRGYAAFTTTPDRPWIKVLHDQGHGHDPDWHCPTPESKVLTADLRWVPAGALTVGDVLVGFDEQFHEGKFRRFRTSYVTHAKSGRQQAMQVWLSDGTSIVVSRRHQWLVIAAKGRGRRVNRWVETHRLRRGMQINRWFQPWDTRRTWEAGYLAGFYDGEGHITKLSYNQPLTVGAAQKKGATLDAVLSMLREQKYPHRLVSVGRERDADCVRFFISGTVADRARFLGEVRPERLLAKFQPEMLGALRTGAKKSTIVDVQDVGIREVVYLSTSTRTYVLEGLPSHNCTCEVDAKCNPFTFDQRARDRDDPEKNGIMTRERFAIAWQGKLGHFVGRVYSITRGQQQFSPSTHSMIWKKGVLDEALQAPASSSVLDSAHAP